MEEFPRVSDATAFDNKGLMVEGLSLLVFPASLGGDDGPEIKPGSGRDTAHCQGFSSEGIRYMGGTKVVDDWVCAGWCARDDVGVSRAYWSSPGLAFRACLSEHSSGVSRCALFPEGVT